MRHVPLFPVNCGIEAATLVSQSESPPALPLPLSLLKMVVRFARIDPVELDKIKARKLDPIALKEEWIRHHRQGS